MKQTKLFDLVQPRNAQHENVSRFYPRNLSTEPTKSIAQTYICRLSFNVVTHLFVFVHFIRNFFQSTISIGVLHGKWERTNEQNKAIRCAKCIRELCGNCDNFTCFTYNERMSSYRRTYHIHDLLTCRKRLFNVKMRKTIEIVATLS